MELRALTAAGAAILLLAGCGDRHATPGFDDLSDQVSDNRVGADADQWIEMLNLVGEWERTGLIFGYGDDFSECQKAIEGLKKANYSRDYRCVPAN